MTPRHAASFVCASAAALVLGLSAVTVGAAEDAKVEPMPSGRRNPNAALRGGFDNARIRFERDGEGHVAFIGGSITEMNGYRPMVCEILRKRFPKTKFTFTDAGISSTCSTTGAFRLKAHVLDKGRVDLLLAEFAVNDDQDAAHARRNCIRGMEGLVRIAREHNPNMDIIITYFVNPGMMKLYQAGKTPLSIAAHGEVAKHYAISTVNLAKEVARSVRAGKFTWKKFGGTHPAPFGNRMCAEMIRDLLSAAWARPLPKDAKLQPHALPAKPLDPLSYSRGRFVNVRKAKTDNNWRVRVPDWAKLKGNCRTRFRNATMLTADTAGATLTLEFTGTAVGAYLLAGPDAGIVEARVDDGPPRKIDLHHRFSRGLHYPRTCMFAADLKPGKHTLTLRLTAERSPQSTGTAVRILQFVAN